MKALARKLVRKLLNAKSTETIKDAWDRHVVHWQRFCRRSKYDTAALTKALRQAGINPGDTIMVHASWRQFYNYKGTPADLIRILQEIVGPEGTILMPSYGASREFFDVQHTPSNAGVLSEIFRQQPGVLRSRCTHFAVAGWGKKAAVLLEEAEQSHYGFDEYSPYYKLTAVKGAKLLFLGLGKEPSKVSMLHCAAYALRNTDEKLARVISKKYESVLVQDGIKHIKNMVIRQDGHSNISGVFQAVVRAVQNKSQMRLSNLDIVQLNAAETFEQACCFIKQKKYFYKNMEKL